MKPGMDNVEGIAEMVPPKTVMGIRHFLGATSFYQRFIKGYTKITQRREFQAEEPTSQNDP